MNGREFAEAIRRARAEIDALWADADRAALERLPGVQSDMSIKDLLAHLTFWEQKMLLDLRAGRRDERLTDKKIDALNAETLRYNRARPLDAVIADYRRSGLEVIEAVAALSDADLDDPARFPWVDDRTLREWIEVNTLEHYPEHLPALRAWRERL